MSSLPATYKAAIVKAPGAGFSIVDIPLRPPVDDEVLLKVYASGICYSDLATTAGSPLTSYPRVPGHEVVARVVSHGPGVSSREAARLTIGSLVGAGWIAGGCTTCEACRDGELYACPEGIAHGAGVDGGHAEYMYSRPQGLVRIPEEALNVFLCSELAPILCAGVSAHSALLACKDSWQPGDVIGIYGIGGIGHLAIQYASKMGLQVHAITSSPEKAALARSFGAVGTVSPSEDIAAYFSTFGYAQVILSTSPAPNELSGILAQSLRRNGTLMLVGLPYGGGDDSFALSSTTTVVKRLKIRGWVPSSPIEYEAAVRFSIQAGIRPIVKVYRLWDIQLAMDDLLNGRPAQRNVISFL